MTNLITRLEQAETGSRELSDEVLLAPDFLRPYIKESLSIESFPATTSGFKRGAARAGAATPAFSRSANIGS